MSRASIGILLAVAVMVGGFGGYRLGFVRGVEWFSTQILQHKFERQRVIEQQSAVFPKGGVLLLGDSITEQAYLPTLCDRPVLNAAVAGATLADLASLVDAVVQQTEPALTVIMIGTNDALQMRADGWQAALDKVVAAQRERTKVVLVSPPPLSESIMASPKIADALGRIQAAAAAVAASEHVDFIDLNVALGGSPLAPALRSDEVHLSPAGYVKWRAALDGIACPAKP